MIPYLSLVVPCYNEAEHLEKSFPKVIEILQKLRQPFEVIIIDDCSQDKTVDIIRELIRKNKGVQIRFIQHKKNVGRGGTVTEGMRLARGKIVGFIDIDLEISPKYIPDFVEAIHKNKADIVVARRFYRFSMMRLHRIASSKLYAALIQYTLGLPIRDTEAGYKFFNREKILPILKKIKDTKWFWDTEIVARGHLNGLKLMEIDVPFERRHDKTSTVKLAQDSIQQLKSFIAFKKSLSNE